MKIVSGAEAYDITKSHAKPESKPKEVHIPTFSTESCEYVKIFFADGKPSLAVRNLLKEKKFRFEPENKDEGVKAFWYGEKAKLEGTPFNL